MDILKSFSESLTELIDNKNLTNQQLGDSLGVSHVAVSSWRNGTSYIYLSNLIKLADYFSCSIEYLLGNTTEILTFKPSTSTPFYPRLREVMQIRNVSRYRIAKDTRVKDNYFTTWSKGTDIHLLMLLELANYLDCTVDFLVGYDK